MPDLQNDSPSLLPGSSKTVNSIVFGWDNQMARNNVGKECCTKAMFCILDIKSKDTHFD